MITTMVPGLTNIDPMPYRYRRWNGVMWADAHVDAYNRELTRIVSMHRGGYDVARLVDGLYNLANQFDQVR